MTTLDQDFETITAQINAKIQESADALREAVRLAKEAGMDSLIYTQWTGEYLGKKAAKELSEKLENINVSDLENAMSEAGWTPSSSYC